MFSNARVKRKAVRALTGNVRKRYRMKQTLSDDCSATKRAAKDILFKVLGYEMRLSRDRALATEKIR